MSTSATHNKRCAVCAVPATTVCGGCKDISYCSHTCLKVDRDIHKTFCKKFAAVRDSPSSNMMRVLTFPVEKSDPEFVWMPIKDAKRQHPVFGGFFGSGPKKPDFTCTQGFALHPRTGHRLPHRIIFEFRDDGKRDGSLPNQSILGLTNGVTYDALFGGFIAYGNKHKPNANGKIEHVNLDTNAVNLIKEYFTFGRYKLDNEDLYLLRLAQTSGVIQMSMSLSLPAYHSALESEMAAQGRTIPQFGESEIGSPAYRKWAEETKDFQIRWFLKMGFHFWSVPLVLPAAMSEEEMEFREDMMLNGDLVLSKESATEWDARHNHKGKA